MWILFWTIYNPFQVETHYHSISHHLDKLPCSDVSSMTVDDCHNMAAEVNINRCSRSHGLVGKHQAHSYIRDTISGLRIGCHHPKSTGQSSFFLQDVPGWHDWYASLGEQLCAVLENWAATNPCSHAAQPAAVIRVQNWRPGIGSFLSQLVWIQPIKQTSLCNHL